VDKETSFVVGVQKWSNEAVVIYWLIVFRGEVDFLDGRLAVFFVGRAVRYLFGVVTL